MAVYDSESSSDDDGDYTTTNVVLGYASSESSGDEISHVGGHPVWLDSKITPPLSLVRCKVCSSYMTLLLQLNADLQQYFPNDQRRLQVWCCKNKTCARKPGSIRVLREVKKGRLDKPAKADKSTSTPQKSTVDLGNALFGGNTTTSNGNINPFSADSTSQSALDNPFSSIGSPSVLAAKPPQAPVSDVQPPVETFAQKLKLDEPTNSQAELPASEDWPEVKDFPQPYPFFYLDAYPEELGPDPTPTLNDAAGSSSNLRYEPEESSTSALDRDTFESSLDKTFQKFSQRVAHNDEQVLRYEFKGQPLLYSGFDGVASRFVVPHGKVGAIKGIPRCESCGAQRVFEMQLTPYLIFEIEKDDVVDIDSGMEWGTVIVGTCVNNCGTEGTITFREEWLGVQWEERLARK